MKKIAFLTTILIGITALMEDHLFRGAGMLVGFLLFLSAFAVGDSTKMREHLGFYCFVSGPILVVVAFFLYFFLEVHVITSDNNSKIVSRFFTRSLAVADGNQFEKNQVAYAFTTEYGFIDGIDSDLFYFVYTDHETCVVCDRFCKQIELDAPINLVKQDFKDGTLEFIRDVHGNVYDFHGRPVREGYKPIQNDYTIQDSPLN